MQTRHFGSTVYFSRAQLEATNPSRREGIDAVAEARWRSTTSKLVKAAIKTLKLPDWVYETAMNYLNRFFLTRSISKNDRHLVVGGAILLASKVQESPRSVQDVAYVLLKLKNANKQKQQLGPDQLSQDQFMEGVVLAEQAMLFSLNFNLNVESHISLARRLLEPLDLWAKTNPPLEEAEANQLKLSLYSAVTIFLNDSALTNLSLQYPNHKIAPVTLLMAAKRIVATRFAGKEVPAVLQRVLALANNAAWFESKGLTLEAAADIESQINELYATAPVQPAAQRQQHAPTAANQQAAGQALAANAHHGAEPAAGGAGKGADAAAQGASEREEGEVLPSSVGQQNANSTEHAAAPSTDVAREVHMLAAAAAVPSGTSLLAVKPSPSGLPAATAAGPSQPVQPTSSAAVGPADGGAATCTPPRPPHGTPCHPSQPQQRGRHDGEGDDVHGSDQQATSELHVAPEPQPDTMAGTGGCEDGAAACEEYGRAGDSANENNSPNGLTNGNASGSGCGHADGQPEVSSRRDAPRQQLPPASQPQSPSAEEDAAKTDTGTEAAKDQPRAKRGRAEEEFGGDGGCDDDAGQVVGLCKLRRLEDGGAVAALH